MTPAAVWREISDIHASKTNQPGTKHALRGATGTIDFGGVVRRQVPIDKPVGILQVQGGGNPQLIGLCGKLRNQPQATWCPPGD
ncbi:MAG: hypothetical protein ACRDQ5_19070 [Sciscionella sp.]